MTVGAISVKALVALLLLTALGLHTVNIVRLYAGKLTRQVGTTTDASI